MTDPAFHGKRPVYSASAALEALGKTLGEIKTQDRMTWSDIGAVLGVSEDQVAKYAAGEATMNVVTYGRGKKEWNGRFTGLFDRLCVDSRPGISGRQTENLVLRAALGLSASLADDNHISTQEIYHHRTELEEARDAIDALLERLSASPRAVA